MSNAGQFEKGQSGNPVGKAKGTRNRTTLALEAIFEGEAEAIIRKAIELAQEGDTVALRLCMDLLIPVRKDRPVRFELPAIESRRGSAEGHTRAAGVSQTLNGRKNRL